MDFIALSDFSRSPLWWCCDFNCKGCFKWLLHRKCNICLLSIFNVWKYKFSCYLCNGEACSVHVCLCLSVQGDESVDWAFLFALFHMENVVLKECWDVCNFFSKQQIQQLRFKWRINRVSSGTFHSCAALLTSCFGVTHLMLL